MIVCEFCNTKCDDDMICCYTCGKKLLKEFKPKVKIDSMMETVSKKKQFENTTTDKKRSKSTKMNVDIMKHLQPQENSKKLTGMEIILYSFEALVMGFDIIFGLVSFGTGSFFASLFFMVSAFLISPFCEKFLRKIPVTSFQNSIFKRVGIQIFISAVIFIIGEIQL